MFTLSIEFVLISNHIKHKNVYCCVVFVNYNEINHNYMRIMCVSIKFNKDVLEIV